MRETFCFAVAPFVPADEPAVNLARAREYVAEAADQGADVVCFSEMFLGLTPLKPLPNAFVEGLCEAAASHAINVITGTIRAPTDVPRKAHLWNVVINRQGEIVGMQAKRIMYPGERAWFVPAGPTRLFELDFGPVVVLAGLDAFDASNAAWAASVRPSLLVLQTGASTDDGLALQAALCNVRAFEMGATVVTPGRLGTVMSFNFLGGGTAYAPPVNGEKAPRCLFTLGIEEGVFVATAPTREPAAASAP